MNCRICFEDGDEDDLVIPCLCAGSVQYIHKDCLRKELEARTQRGLQTRFCTICHGHYTWVPAQDEHRYPFLTLPMSLAFVVNAHQQDPAIRAMLILLLLFNILLMYPLLGLHFSQTTRKIGQWIFRATACYLILIQWIPAFESVRMLAWIFSYTTHMVLLWKTRDMYTPLRAAIYCFGVLETSIILLRIQELNQVPGLDVLFVTSIIVPMMLFSTIRVEDA
jgi:hypothetical protein